MLDLSATCHLLEYRGGWVTVVLLDTHHEFPWYDAIKTNTRLHLEILKLKPIVRSQFSNEISYKIVWAKLNMNNQLFKKNIYKIRLQKDTTAEALKLQ